MMNIFTDSCSDLGKELEQLFNIHSVPLTVIHREKTYRDGVDIQSDDLFGLVEQYGELPKTSAPSMVDFVEYFSEVEGDILFVGISSHLSATVQNAMLAGRELTDRQVCVIDSLNLSSGIGLLALKAADLRASGHSLDETDEILRSSVEKVHTSFMIDRLDYMYMGGRCSAMESIVGSMLKIRPIIEMRKDGTLGVREKIRGHRHKALDTMLDEFGGHLEEIELTRVFITHTGCDEDAVYLKEALLKMAPIEDVFITRAGSTVSSHCGPGTIGILYMTK